MISLCAERDSVMNRHLQQSMEALTRFREQVIAARHQAGYLQKDLASALALDAETLSRKLHGRHQAILTLQDVKQIIKTLAAWRAITTRAEALELLGLLRPGGVGKTRLAFEVVRSLNASFADGVSIVPLASLHDPALLPSRILEACGLLEDASERLLVETPRTGLDLLIGSLAQDERLLVLDNFEHLLEASTVVGELLAAASGLKVLVTSRGVLHLYGEHIWEVPPLELVDPRHLPDLAS